MPVPRKLQGQVRSPAAALSRTLLLAPDQAQTILIELDRTGPNPLVYTPYGSQSSPLPAHSRLGFNGQFKERPTGWYHLGNGHRVYNPVFMRFHSPDRLSPFNTGGLNPYAYCVGDPVNFTDPTGQVPEWLQPILTIGLHVGIIAATVMTAIVTPAAGVALWAARTSMVGSPVAIVGSAMQLAGAKEEGRIISAIGTVFSIGAVATRTGVGIKNLMGKPNPASQSLAGLKNLFGVRRINSVNANSNPIRPSEPPRASMEKSRSPVFGQQGRDIKMVHPPLSATSSHKAGSIASNHSEIRRGGSIR